MGLVKCPDCGKMVSERVSACPACGCPAEFFDSDKEEIPVLADNDEVEESEENNEIFAEFSFLGRTIRYYKSEEIFINMMKRHNIAASELEKELRRQYKDAGNIDKVLSDVIPNIDYTIRVLVKDNLKQLYKSGINMTEEQFMKKHRVDLMIYIKPIIEEYGKVVDIADELQRVRQIERGSRSQWQGGGFGLKGAIKGAVTATALNAVTNAGRAIGDSKVDSSDNAKIRDAAQRIYNNQDYQDKIFNGFRMCVAKADIGLAEELAKGGITDYVCVDYVEAAQGFISAAQYEENQSEFAQKAIEAIVKYPLSAEFYEPLIKETVENGDDEDFDELISFMEFWNMNGDFVGLFEAAEKRIPVKEYLSQHPEIEAINYEKYDAATYIKVRDAKMALEKVIDGKELPMLVSTCGKIIKYYDECLDKVHTLDSVKVLRDLNENDSAEVFVKKIHDEKVILPGLLKGIWVLGDSDSIPEKKLKNKWNIAESDTIYMYQNKAIFGTVFGGDGFVLTEHILCDLSSKTCINLNHITNIKYDRVNTVSITDGVKEIHINLSEEKSATNLFFYSCLEEFINRYAALTEEEKYEQTIYQTVDRIQKIIAQYAKLNNIDDTDELLINFLVKQGILKEKPLSMFCPFCGEQILVAAKFCNFCGQANTYKK